MDYKGITPSELADSIDVQRSNVTHVLKARNKPSFQFIAKMLQIYPELNAKWLLLGTGSMVETSVKSRDLFDQLTEPEKKPVSNPVKAEEKPPVSIQEPEAPKEIHNPPTPEKKISDNELQDQFFSSEKPIERLVVFYKDQTFKVYNPSR